MTTEKFKGDRRRFIKIESWVKHSITLTHPSGFFDSVAELVEVGEAGTKVERGLVLAEIQSHLVVETLEGHDAAAEVLEAFLYILKTKSPHFKISHQVHL